LDLAFRFRVRHADAEANGLAIALAERREDALADGDLILKRGGNGVGVGMVERPIEDDLRERRGDGRSDFVGLKQARLHEVQHGGGPGARMYPSFRIHDAPGATRGRLRTTKSGYCLIPVWGHGGGAPVVGGVGAGAGVCASTWRMTLLR